MVVMHSENRFDNGAGLPFGLVGRAAAGSTNFASWVAGQFRQSMADAHDDAPMRAAKRFVAGPRTVYRRRGCH